MRFKINFSAMTAGVALALAMQVSPAAAVQMDGVIVYGCQGTWITSEWSGERICAYSGSGGSYGGGDTSGGGGLLGDGAYGGGGGGGGYARYSVGTFHCDYCSMSEKIGEQPKGDTAEFLKTFVNTLVDTWQAPDGTLKNMTICNGVCFVYQYTGGGVHIRVR